MQGVSIINFGRATKARPTELQSRAVDYFVYLKVLTKPPELLLLMVEIAVSQSVFATGENPPISNKSAPNTQPGTEESRWSPGLAVLNPSQKLNQMDSNSQPPSVAPVCWRVCYRIVFIIYCTARMPVTQETGIKFEP